MASSSQANQPLYDEVFISFSGKDVRNNFVSHLHSALKGKGIRTYSDEDNLQQGQTIGIEMIKAIKESRIAIVVLSENYGSSKWCLNELVEIMECKNKTGLIVFPIFYHVDPSVVRNQKEGFAKAFYRYEDEGEKVKSWREALTQVSNLKGEHIHEQQNEALRVRKIIGKIFDQLPVKASDFRKSCVGIESRILEIRKLMDSKPHEVLFIGLWGMGGVGKTTLARAIFEDYKETFKGSCFLENVKVKKSEIHILQKNLLDAVLKKKLNGIDDVVTGASMIQERLRCKKVLLVIDDVDNIQQLNALANQCDWFGNGSRIIITTSDKHLIDEVHIEKFEVHRLPLNEALHLFSLHAFKDDHPHEDFKDLSDKILHYVDGLPLALSVLGDLLRQRPKDMWEDVLERLKDAPPDDIMEILTVNKNSRKMASSSQANQPLPYEVFINFRGEDTRNTFVSHLHSALKHKGIQTYYDENNLQKGQTIGTELVKAIEQSRIAIVVLSEDYGSSTWCLNELVKIMECKNRSGLIAIPIFYHIPPSVVRNQKGKFTEAFSNYEVDLKDEGEKVKSWREALTQVSNLSGEHIHKHQDEAFRVKEIVKKISDQLPVKSSDFKKSCVGMESRISEIRELMDSKPDEVLFIGLWGMGGIGKTTIARVIFEDCRRAFDASCFLEDVKETRKRIHILQQNLLFSMLKEKFEDIQDVVRGTIMIKERLQFKKVLIVIDDVDDKQQLNYLANQCDWFGKGSRIIITTRNKHLINEVHVEKFEVRILPNKDALHLFSLHAFKEDHPHEDFKDLSNKILHYVDGLPLALSVLGEHLYRRKKDFWEDVLSNLEDGPPDEIMEILKISFDGLDVPQQDIFLDIACFFCGHPKDRVEERLDSLRLHPKQGIDLLCERSLIYMRVDEDTGSHLIEMHDLLREMAWSIVRKGHHKRSLKDDIRRYNRLWLEEDIVEVLSSRTTEPCDVERLVARFDPPADDEQMKANLGWKVTFSNMNKLGLLELQGDFFKGNYNANVTQPFGQSGNNLRWFSWYKYPGKCLPKGFHPRYLVQLHMSCSKIEETPDFSHMPNLEVVNINFSNMLVCVHPSLGKHRKIKRVDLSYCTSLEKFPSIYSMVSLKSMDLSHSGIQNFPEICGNLDSLEKLKLKATPIISGLPKSILGYASRLQKLKFDCDIGYKEDFTSLDVVEKSFPILVSIVIRGSGINSTLDFSHLPNLEKLDLKSSEELIEVHASLGKHKKIKSINLAGCSKLKDFPPIVDMESLEKLDLSGTRLQNFPEMSGNVKRLVKLDLDRTEITSLPWSIGCATSLEILRMVECEYLRQLPDTILGEEILIGSKSLKNFMKNIDDGVASSRIQCIYFRNCKILEELPESLLSRIEFLQIEDYSILMSWICSKLVYLLGKHQHLCNLRLHPTPGYMAGGSTKEFLRALSEWEPVCNMLRKRKEPLEVCGPGTHIPSWFKHQFSNRRSMTMYLPPLSDWYNDKLRGFCLGYVSHGINRQGDGRFCEPTSCYKKCCNLRELHLFVRYIPIGDLSEIIGDPNAEDDERILFEQTSEIDLNNKATRHLSMGLSFVYSEDEVNEAPPLQPNFVKDDPYSTGSPFKDIVTTLFRVKLAARKDR